jgi:mannose-6-phosphate isomerase-like protein (cupin superfamily)
MNKVQNIYEILENAKVDEKVGVKLANVLEGETFNLYALEIAPKKRVGAHYHSTGNETYEIISGKGAMMIGKQSKDSINWNKPQFMNKGDCLNVNANEIHQLINLSDEPLICIVGCSLSHITTDRTMTNGYGEI